MLTFHSLLIRKAALGSLAHRFNMEEKCPLAANSSHVVVTYVRVKNDIIKF